MRCETLGGRGLERCAARRYTRMEKLHNDHMSMLLLFHLDRFILHDGDEAMCASYGTKHVISFCLLTENPCMTFRLVANANIGRMG